NAFTAGGFNWSPDGTRIAFSAARNPDLGMSHTADIYVLSLADQSIKKIVDTEGPDTNPVWSPDGKSIAYETANAREFYYYSNHHIAVVNADGGKPRVLTEQFDENPQLIEWGERGIYFSALQNTARFLFRLHPETKAVTRLGTANASPFTNYSFTRDFRQ